MKTSYRIFVILLLAIHVGYVLYSLPALPETIPTHFDVNGEIDGWGSKYTILIPMCIQLLVNLLLEYTARHPEKHNYMTQITDENREQMFAASSALLRKMNIAVAIIFMTISYSIVRQQLPTIVIISELIGLFVLIITHLIRSSKTR